MQEYYQAEGLVGGSVPATEHSVMSAGGNENEFETIERLITEVHPSGIVSIVSDTWNYWKALEEIYKPLKEKILSRDGRVVIRPDSGNPVDIICGYNTYNIGCIEIEDMREYLLDNHKEQKGLWKKASEEVILWPT